jgi:hypothetical protein
VFVSRFSFFGRLSGVGGLPFGVFEIAIAARTAILVWCVVSWIRRPSSELARLDHSMVGDQLAEARAPA